MSDGLDKAYETWRGRPGPDTAESFLRAADPILGQAMTSYAGRQNPILKSRAKVLALNALKTYKPGKTKLRTYLLVQLQPLRRTAVRTGQVIRLPERMTYDMRELTNTRLDFKSLHDRDPSDDEIADLTGLSVRRIRMVRKYARPTVTPGQLGEEFEIPAEAPSNEETWLEYVYHELNPKDKQILDWRLGRHGQERLSNNEIAQRLKLSPSAISQRMSRIAERIQAGEGLTT